MDDVLENLSVAWVNFLNLRYGTNVEAKDVVDWKVDKFFPSLTKEQVYSVLWEEDLWKTVKPLDGGPEAIQKLMRDGHEVYIVTNSHYRALAAKMDDVLFAYYPFLSWGQVIIATNKQMIRGDVLIDDGIHNLVGGDYIKILMDRPYNREYDAESMGMYRVSNWREICDLLDTLNGRPSGVGVKIRQTENGGK